MNSLWINDGLSARRKAIDKTKKMIFRSLHLVKGSTKAAFLAGICILLASCHETSKGQDASSQEKERLSVAQDSLYKPKVDIKVNRHYDDDGNLIGFDSVYSSYYSTIQGDTLKMDSLMHSFDSFFNRRYPSFFDDQFNTFFFRDSLRYPDFFHEDFFLKRYELNDDYFREMMQRMDSIKNRFYREQSMEEKRSLEL